MSIDIRKLNSGDVNREVRYSVQGLTEWGKIVRWNDRFIFVRYYFRQYDGGPPIPRTGETPEATDPGSLEFV
jgi:hypothetical protein